MHKNSRQVFDTVFKSMLANTPEFIIWLINEVFGKNIIAEDASYVQLHSEHVRADGKKVTDDSCICIDGIDYHIECQSNPDGTMAIRMFEYDFMIALEGAEKAGGEYTVRYPNSCVLYLRHNEETPDKLIVHVIFANDKRVDYEAPIVKANNYTIEQIFEKKLFVLVPYYILRYEKELEEINNDDEKLKAFLADYDRMCDMIIKALNNKILSLKQVAELNKLLQLVNDWVAKGKTNVKEVMQMSGTVLESEGKRLFDGGGAAMLVKLVRKNKLSKESAEEEFGGTYEEIVAAANKGKRK